MINEKDYARRLMRGEIVPSRSTVSRNKHRDPFMLSIFSKPGLGRLVAEHVGASQQAVSAWNRVPAQFVLDLAELFEIDPVDIRPDVFGATRKIRRGGKR